MAVRLSESDCISTNTKEMLERISGPTSSRMTVDTADMIMRSKSEFGKKKPSKKM